MGELRRFDYFFDQHFGAGIRWNNHDYPIHLAICIPFFAITIGIGNYKKAISKIEKLCQCLKCSWKGLVRDCKCDPGYIDPDGKLKCPECLEVIEVV